MCKTIEDSQMAFLLHVEFDANSEIMATKILGLLTRMADIVHRNHSQIYTYVFRQDYEKKNKLILTELYGNEDVFLDHIRDPEFCHYYRQAFHNGTGQSRKELCIRYDINQPLMPIISNIFNHYLHVTYIPIEQGFLYRSMINQFDQSILIVCNGCDENVYEQLNKLVNCITCITFTTTTTTKDHNRQLFAIIIEYYSNVKISIDDNKPSINTVEFISFQHEFLEKIQNTMKIYFNIRSLYVQTNFSGYIHHK